MITEVLWLSDFPNASKLLAGVINDHFGLLGVPCRKIDLTRLVGILTLLIGGNLIAK